MVWKNINNAKDITKLVKDQLKIIRLASLNIKNIRSAKKNLKKGDKNIKVNILKKF